MVFNAYLHFEHAMASDELGQADTDDIQDFWLVDRDGRDLTMPRLEQLLERRSDLLNSVLLTAEAEPARPGVARERKDLPQRSWETCRIGTRA